MQCCLLESRHIWFSTFNNTWLEDCIILLHDILKNSSVGLRCGEYDGRKDNWAPIWLSQSQWQACIEALSSIITECGLLQLNGCKRGIGEKVLFSITVPSKNTSWMLSIIGKQEWTNWVELVFECVKCGIHATCMCTSFNKSCCDLIWWNE